MGYRGHVRTVNKIEYGTGMGNHLHSHLSDFFNECRSMLPNLYGSDDEKETWDFEREIFIDLIKILKNAPKNVREKMGAILKEPGDFASNQDAFEYALECCQTWLEEADPNNDYITVDWY